jgi:hypothetical protein
MSMEMGLRAQRLPGVRIRGVLRRAAYGENQFAAATLIREAEPD